MEDLFFFYGIYKNSKITETYIYETVFFCNLKYFIIQHTKEQIVFLIFTSLTFLMFVPILSMGK